MDDNLRHVLEITDAMGLHYIDSGVVIVMKSDRANPVSS